MIDESFDIAAKDLLDRVKAQDTPWKAQPRLCSVFREKGKNLPKPILKWALQGGEEEGGDIMIPLQGEQLETANRLLQAGCLVPTWKNSELGEVFHQVEHFDDLAWGRTENGAMVVYRLNKDPEQLDDIMFAHEIPEALRYYSERGIEQTYMNGEAITLKGLGTVTPVLTRKTGVSVPPMA